jgi:LysR family transcriptional activator of nhaA
LLQSLNLKHIYYFWVVARESSILKASTFLNVSSSSISEQIKTLEVRLGIVLFDRAQKKMSLSEAGKELYKELNKIFPRMDELFESIVNHKNLDVKQVNIGFCPTLSKDVRFKLSFDLIEDPQYTVKIHQGENSYLMSEFNNGEIDLFYTTNSKVNVRGDYIKMQMGTKKYSLVCNTKFFKSLKSKTGFKVIHNQRFINYTPDNELHFNIHKLIKKENIHPVRSAEIDDINLIKETILEVDCFAILPDNSIKQEIKNKSLTKIKCNLNQLDTPILAYYQSKFDEAKFLSHLEMAKKRLINRS